MNNKEIKQQENTAQCAICIVMRCAWKWLVAVGVISLIIQLFTAVTMLVLNGNEKVPKWAEMWIGLTLMVLLLGGLAALLTYWKDVKEWVCDELRCA